MSKCATIAQGNILANKLSGWPIVLLMFLIEYVSRDYFSIIFARTIRGVLLFKIDQLHGLKKDSIRNHYIG